MPTRKAKLKLRANRRKAKPSSPNLLRLDPTRTQTLRRVFLAALFRRFARLKGKVVALIAGRDSLGLKPRPHAVEEVTANRDRLDLQRAVELAAKDADPSPSPDQREAGNYRKGHVTIQGLDITIETARGVKRQPHHAKALAHHYGYLKRTESEADGDHVDIFIGPDPDSEVVFIIDQYRMVGAVENAELEGGRWVTTDEGNRLYIKDGEAIAGNPHVLAAIREGKDKKSNQSPKALTNIKDMIALQASHMEDSLKKKGYGGWNEEFTEKGFKKNWTKALKGLEADPARVPGIQKSIDAAYKEYDIPYVPFVVRKQTADEKALGENAHWDGHMVVISDDVEDERRYHTAVKPLDSDRKTTVKEAYPDLVAGLIVHELGHKYHDDNPEALQRARGVLTEITKEDKKEVSRRVSSYGASHPQELVAEVYAMSKHPGYQALSDETKALVEYVLYGKGSLSPQRTMTGNTDRTFDEHKCLLGFTNSADAKQGYLDSYPDSWQGLGGMRALTIGQFKRWLAEGDTGKPIIGQLLTFNRSVQDSPFTLSWEERWGMIANFSPDQPRDEHGRWEGGGETERPPAKPTAEEFEHWLDKGWEWGDEGWKPPQRVTKPAVSEHISQETHGAAKDSLTDKDRSLVATSHGWEQTKPWNVTEEQMRTNPPKGFALTKKSHGEEAHFSDGTVHLSPKFFQPPMSSYEEARRHLVYHELGHMLADTMVRDGTSFQLHDAGVIPAKHDLGSGTAGGHGDEEALADAYALLHTDPVFLTERYPKMAEHVTDRARALGLPLPASKVSNTTVSFFQGMVTANTRWADLPDADKVTAFQDWLEEQFAQEGITGLSGEQLWDRYIGEGFRRGAGRAFDDVNRSALASAGVDPTGAKGLHLQGGRDQFLRGAFGQPVAVEKVKLLAGRSFDEMEGLIGEMRLKMSRVLTDGLVTGKSPYQVARDLTGQIDVSRTRAETIARTELSRTHSSGQLHALRQLGVEEVGVMVEFTTAGDPCSECSALAGTVLKLDEAEGLIPQHPNCRCCWTPANVGEDTAGQVRDKDDIDDALEEAGEDPDDFDIAVSRPRSVFDDDEEGDTDNEEAQTATRYVGLDDMDDEERETLLGEEEGSVTGNLFCDGMAWNEFDEDKHPRDEKGKFSAHPGAEHGSSVKVRKTKDRAWDGDPVELKETLTKQETGRVGEAVGIAFLKTVLGKKDVQPMNKERTNFPVDVLEDHAPTEVKAGLANVTRGAQQWRLTFSKESKAEKELYAKMTAKQRAKWNADKQARIHERKLAVIKKLERETGGKKITPRTLTVIVNPDKKVADVYIFDGFHSRIGWKSEQAQKAYVGSVKYDHPK